MHASPADITIIAGAILLSAAIFVISPFLDYDFSSPAGRFGTVVEEGPVQETQPTGATSATAATQTLDLSGYTKKTTVHYYAGQSRIAEKSEGALAYVHGDNLGNEIFMTSTAGTEVPGSRITYDSFGYSASEDAVYTGHAKDGDTGLYYARARYYDSQTGRFTSADSLSGSPINPQSLNRYTYVVNNPVKYIDPSGMQGEVYGPPTPLAIKVRNFLENEERLGKEAGGIVGWFASSTASSLKLLLVSTHKEQGEWFQNMIETGGFAGISGGVGGFSDDIVRAISKADPHFASKGGIKRVLFRGDNNVKPDEAFNKGIQAGNDYTITPQEHIEQTLRQSYFDDPWKSATTDENVAAFFAGEMGGSTGGYVYYLAESKGRTIMTLGSISEESEILFKGTIAPEEIIGARKVISIYYKPGVENLYDPSSVESVWLGDFIPNPRYKD